MNDIIDLTFPPSVCIDKMQMDYIDGFSIILSISHFLSNFFPLLNNIVQVNDIDKITIENKKLFFVTKEFILFYYLVNQLPDNTKSVLRISFYSKYLKIYVKKLNINWKTFNQFLPYGKKLSLTTFNRYNSTDQFIYSYSQYFDHLINVIHLFQILYIKKNSQTLSIDNLKNIILCFDKSFHTTFYKEYLKSPNKFINRLNKKNSSLFSSHASTTAREYSKKDLENYYSHIAALTYIGKKNIKNE